MSLLEQIIDGATDDAVSTSNLLRKVQVVAHRLQAHDIQSWVQHELNGYPSVDGLPPYRILKVNVMGTWAGPMQSRMEQPLSAGRIPDNAAEVLFTVRLSSAVAELEELAVDKSDGTLGVPWDPVHVGMYNTWAEAGLVPRIQFYGLLSANRIVTRGTLRAIIDAARNTALGFALDLQATAPNAGSTDGPTMSASPIAQVVNNYYSTHIEGNGNQVAQGEYIHQKSSVVKGDLQSLLRAARETGLSDEGTSELEAVVSAPEDERPGRIGAFLGKIRTGAYIVGTGVASEFLATELTTLINAYLGISS